MKIHQCTLISHKFLEVELTMQCLFFFINLFCIAKLFSKNCLPILLQSTVYKRVYLPISLLSSNIISWESFLTIPPLKELNQKDLKRKWHRFWKDGSMNNSTSCSCRGTEFGSQNPHGVRITISNLRESHAVF